MSDGASSASEVTHAVILAVSSDIGLAIASDWIDRGIKVTGTYRTHSKPLDVLQERGLIAIEMDLNDEDSVLEVGRQLSMKPWHRVVLAGGDQQPVGLFSRVDQREWAKSISSNFTRQFQFLGTILPGRVREAHQGPRVLAFAGGATNRATTHYSAYSISKIASIKMIELLAAEIPDTGFVIVGPGWVKTKIHNATEIAGSEAGDNLYVTRQHIQEDDFYPMESLISCINWIFDAPIEHITGRNFSAVFDPWGQDKILRALEIDSDLFKLRRYGNDRFN